MTIRLRPAIGVLLLVSALGPAGETRADRPPTPEESLAALRLADPSLKVEIAAADQAQKNGDNRDHEKYINDLIEGIDRADRRCA